ncbi:hypothetical protein ACFQU3_10595 [Terrabacter sp. GCM10028922]|uniref:hypothetical protein n=1 Tax=Terrabacter sp. GCM10028922 TaxID=3273428 RepID=UPI0036173B18
MSVTGARARVAAFLAAGVLASGGCVAPAPDTGAFRQNALAALESARSEARSAALAVEARLRDRLTQQYAITLLTDHDEALGPIEDSFGNVDPPAPDDDPLRDQVMDLLGDTSDALSTARLSVRRDDRDALRDDLTALRQLGDRLDEAAEALK